MPRCAVTTEPCLTGRTGTNARYSMQDFALAAFAPFFMPSLSFLAPQRFLETGHCRSNCQTLFGKAKIPCDNQMRTMLDPVEPTHCYPMFADIVAEFQQSGGLDAMCCLDGRLLIALDGTEYFHMLLAATVVAPGHNRAVPLEPEFIVPQDRLEKQDCESRAARRWLAARGALYRRFDPVYLGDDLFSQFRPREEAPCQRARHPKPAGLCLSHRLRPGRQGVEGRETRTGDPSGLRSYDRRADHVSSVPVLGSPTRDYRLRPASSVRPIAHTKKQRREPRGHASGHNENCWTDTILLDKQAASIRPLRLNDRSVTWHPSSPSTGPMSSP